MTRATQTISFALLVTSLYLALYLQLIPLPPLVQSEIVPIVRWRPSRPSQPAQATFSIADQPRNAASILALVSFGAYLLFRLGWYVLTFNDVPEAHKELTAEIEMAKADLRSKGVDVD